MPEKETSITVSVPSWVAEDLKDKDIAQILIDYVDLHSEN